MITLFIVENGKGDSNKIIESISEYVSLKEIIRIKKYEEVNWHNVGTKWYAVFESSEEIPEELSSAFPSFLQIEHDLIVLFKEQKEYIEFKPYFFKSYVTLNGDGSPNEFGGCLTSMKVLNGTVRNQC